MHTPIGFLHFNHPIKLNNNFVNDIGNAVTRFGNIEIISKDFYIIFKSR